MKRIKAFFLWLIVGKILGEGWSGEACPSCGEVHTFGALGSWRCPLKQQAK